MTQIIEKSEVFEIDGIEYFITFSIEAEVKGFSEEYSHFGPKFHKVEKELDFELLEILGVMDTEKDEEITITKDLEKKIRPLLHNWISENCDELAQQISEF